MMYFDRPGLVLLVSLGVFGPLAGLAIVKYLNGYKTPHGVDALFSGMTLSSIILFVGLVISAWIAAMYDEYKKMSERDGVRPVRIPDPKPERVLLDMNTGKPMYAFQTPAVKIDHMSRKIKHFCIVLINQRDNGFKIDLKEETWKKHFGGRDNYVQVRDVRLAGAFAKEHPERANSPFIVCGESGWRIVEDGARGKV